MCLYREHHCISGDKVSHFCIVTKCQQWEQTPLNLLDSHDSPSEPSLKPLPCDRGQRAYAHRVGRPVGSKALLPRDAAVSVLIRPSDAPSRYNTGYPRIQATSRRPPQGHIHPVHPSHAHHVAVCRAHYPSTDSVPSLHPTAQPSPSRQRSSTRERPEDIARSQGRHSPYKAALRRSTAHLSRPSPRSGH